MVEPEVEGDKASRNMATFLSHMNKNVTFDLEKTDYRPIKNIGSGAYGVVCSAEHIVTGDKVAIKKIARIFEHLEIAKRTYREIRILGHFQHDNIIAIRRIFSDAEVEGRPRDPYVNDVYIVLDLMDYDLHKCIYSVEPLSDDHVTFFMWQLLRGITYIHSANVLHRDLKPSNLFINENCELRIGDFGMSRGVSSTGDAYNHTMTQYVATRWYRAPELLMPPQPYNGAVDIWSVGCIFAEMFRRRQLFKDLTLIGERETLAQLVPGAPSLALELLTSMLTLDPDRRISAAKALSHPYLALYFDPNDKNTCIPVFDYSFEKQNLTADRLRYEIIKEMKKTAPAVEPTSDFNITLIPPSPEQNRDDTTTTISSSSSSYMISNQDVEMLSGKLQFLTVDEAEGRRQQRDEEKDIHYEDVSMKSADTQELATPVIQGSIRTPVGHTMTSSKASTQGRTVNVKEVLAANLRLRKYSNEQATPSEPRKVTAIQRQKEREEKRRFKSKQKNKKKKNSSVEKKEDNLSEQDRSLLQRWKVMQTPNKPSSTICQPDKPHNLSAANNNEDTPPAVFVVDYSTVFSNRGYGIEPTTAPMAPSTSIAPIPMVLATPVANRMPAEIAWTGVNTLAKGEDPVGAHKYLPTYQEALIANRDQLMGISDVDKLHNNIDLQSPLSASLLDDWLSVRGDVTACDLELAQKEVGISSPIIKSL